MRAAIKLFILCFLILVVTDCKKYPDGPSLSFRSKNARVEGNWKIDKYFKNGSEVTQTFIDFYGSDFEWDFKKDATWELKGKYTDHGTWKLGGDKLTLHVYPAKSDTATVDPPQDIYDIQRLANKQLWLLIRYSTGETETFHFKQ